MAKFRRRPPREDLFHLVVSAHFVPTAAGGRKGPIASDYRPNCWFGDEVAGDRLYHDVIFYFREGEDAVEDQGTLWVPPGGRCHADAFPLHPTFLQGIAKPGMTFDVCEGRRVVASATIEAVVDPVPEQERLLFDSRRRFQLWQAGVPHQHLLLRSAKEDDESETKTRVDVLFKPVEGMKIRSVLDGLRVTELPASDAEAILLEVGASGEQPRGHIYRVESGGFTGWVVSGVIGTHQDDLDYHEPSWYFRGPLTL